MFSFLFRIPFPILKNSGIIANIEISSTVLSDNFIFEMYKAQL